MDSKNITKKYFPVALRSIRRAQGVTQETLAERVGVSTSYVGMLEVGARTPSLEMLFRISDALNVRPSEIVDAMDQARA